MSHQAWEKVLEPGAIGGFGHGPAGHQTGGFGHGPTVLGWKTVSPGDEAGWGAELWGASKWGSVGVVPAWQDVPGPEALGGFGEGTFGDHLPGFGEGPLVPGWSAITEGVTAWNLVSELIRGWGAQEWGPSPWGGSTPPVVWVAEDQPL